MKSHITADSLLPNNPQNWHDGSGQVLFSFLEDTMPDYVGTKDKNGDGIADIYKITGTDKINIDADFSMVGVERALALQAITAWNEMAYVNLLEGTNDGISGDITLASTDFNDWGLFGFISAFPRDTSLGLSDRRGDLWINSSNPEQDVSEFGHTSWNTYLHELGHSIGLHHPDEDPDNFDRSLHNNNRYTVMSYNPHPGTRSDDSDDQAWPLTPMLYDIKAIQSLYGANTDTRGSDTVYFGGGHGARETAYQYGADGMTVLGRDVILTVWDGGGIDLLDVSDLGSAVAIDLRPGEFSSIGELSNNVAIAFAVKVDGKTVNWIENAWGSNFDDSIGGNGTRNLLRGLAGDDDLSGLGGRDRLKGGAGDDVLDGGRGRDVLTGGQGADVFMFESVKNEGSDRIMDFKQGIDLIQIAGGSFGDLVLDDTGAGDASVTLDGGTVIVLVGVDYTTLAASDFDFL